MPSLQRRELLAKSQVLKKQIAPSAEHAPNRSEQKPKQVDHVMLLSHLSCGRDGHILLKSQQNRIMARDRRAVTSFRRVFGVSILGRWRRREVSPSIGEMILNSLGMSTEDARRLWRDAGKVLGALEQLHTCHQATTVLSAKW
jgi:hypothetical protein